MIPRPSVFSCLSPGFGIAAVVISSVLLFSSGYTFSQRATFDNTILSVPYITVGGEAYRAELSLLPLMQATEPVQFTVIASVQIPSSDEALSSSFANNVLFIPEIDVAGVVYWAELTATVADVLTLTDYGVHALGSDTASELNTQPQWQRVIGEATDIGIGADGSVWVVGSDERPGGYGIYRWSGVSWRRVDGAAVRIDVDPQGNPWIVNDSHQIYRMLNGEWIRLHGDARDIGIGADGTVWVVAGGGVFSWDGDLSWTRVSGSGVRIDVDPNGMPWLIDYTDDIYQLLAGRWVRRPGEARDIGIGADGSIWIIGTRSDGGGHGVYRWAEDYWNQLEGSGRQISVGADGLPWTVSSDGKIFSSQ